LLFAVSFNACNSQNPEVKNIPPSDFEVALAQKNAQIIDVRTPQEYTEKHIDGAKNININDEHFESQMSNLDKSKPVYIYCLAGSRSRKAAEWAATNGFKEIYNLEGGINAWLGEKKPVVTGSGAPVAGGMSFDDYLLHIKNADKLVLVDFNAVWCGPCKLLKPIVNKVVKRNSAQVQLFEIDVDRNSTIAAEMKIRSIPLLILYKGGKEVWRSMGLIEEELLEAKVKEFSK
jgi:thioredoxin 1